MQVALSVALGSIAIAPFFGRWRANVWLQRQLEEAEARAHAAPAPRSRRNNVIEIA